MDMENFTGSQGMFIRVIMFKMRETDMERCTLQMGQFIKVIGVEGYNTDKL
jgi:hypothetical protein